MYSLVPRPYHVFSVTHRKPSGDEATCTCMYMCSSIVSMALFEFMCNVCREFLGPIVGGGLTHFINFQDSALVSSHVRHNNNIVVTALVLQSTDSEEFKVHHMYSSSECSMINKIVCYDS
jgi:hypothetical protein